MQMSPIRFKTEWMLVIASPLLMETLVEEAGPALLNIVEAARVQPLNRYNLRQGRIFGNPIKKERYRILDVTSNSVLYKDLLTHKVEMASVDELLEKWNIGGISELSPTDEILAKIKQMLTPFLGGVLVGALINWLTKKLS